jgi:hypothetical protein
MFAHCGDLRTQPLSARECPPLVPCLLEEEASA